MFAALPLALVLSFALPASSDALLARPAPAADPFVFEDGDRVVFLGGTLIEREQKFGHWELALTLKNAGKKVSFRNLGWSGDTVHCESRGSFDGPAKGFERTTALVKELKPTVIVVCYGHNESFGGEAGVDKFKDGLKKLTDAMAPTNARFVFMSPTPFENVKPVSDADEKNKRLEFYAKALGDFAENQKAAMFPMLQVRKLFKLSAEPFTENGIHLSDAGYAATSVAFGQPVATGVDALREKIVEKNRLFFHRWRPQNETYLFGFRKHEQGRNAKEVAEFDPLVSKAEDEIRSLLSKK